MTGFSIACQYFPYRAITSMARNTLCSGPYILSRTPPVKGLRSLRDALRAPYDGHPTFT